MKMHTLDETAPPASIVYYEFPARGKLPPLKLSWYDGGLKPRMPDIPKPEENQERRRRSRPPSVVFFGDKGILMCSDYGDRVRTIPAEIMEKYEQPETASQRNRHELNWIQACKGGEPAVSNFDYSGPFTEIVLLGNIAIRAGSGKKLLWDGENMNFTNEPEANKYVTKEYRESWTL